MNAAFILIEPQWSLVRTRAVSGLNKSMKLARLLEIVSYRAAR
jgi:hypothetical protein